MRRKTPAIISLVGRSGSGKTTFLEKLIEVMKERGYRVATIKHDPHGGDIDTPGKDSWRHARAGADTVLIMSPRKISMVKKTDAEHSLDEAARWLLHDTDIVITEGFKKLGKPKIKVIRAALGGEPVSRPEELIALVSDIDLTPDVPRFDLGDAAGVADLIERKFGLTPAGGGRKGDSLPPKLKT